MSYDLSEEDAVRVMALGEGERVSEFLHRAAETDEIWTIGTGDELVVLGDDEGHSFIVVWPHPEFGQRWYAETELDDVELVAVGTKDFANEILPGLAEANIDVVVFPALDGTGAGVDSLRLRDILHGALEHKDGKAAE